jgi:hypothetical protein
VAASPSDGQNGKQNAFLREFGRVGYKLRSPEQAQEGSAFLAF